MAQQNFGQKEGKKFWRGKFALSGWSEGCPAGKGLKSLTTVEGEDRCYDVGLFTRKCLCSQYTLVCFYNRVKKEQRRVREKEKGCLKALWF